MSKGNLLSQQILVGIILVGRLAASGPRRGVGRPFGSAAKSLKSWNGSSLARETADALAQERASETASGPRRRARRRPRRSSAALEIATSNILSYRKTYYISYCL